MNYDHFLLLFFVIIIAGTELQYLMSCGCFAIIFYDLLCCCFFLYFPTPLPSQLSFHDCCLEEISMLALAGINNFFRSINNNSEWQFTSQMHFMDSKSILNLLCSRFACDSCFYCMSYKFS